jgi:hypothetical protein
MGGPQREMAMNQADSEIEPETEGTDRHAILMMLAYVEAECRRLGSEDAARHAALAANLVEVAGPEAGCLANSVSRRQHPVH